MAKAEAKSPAQNAQQRNILIAMDGSKHANNAFEWYAENMYTDADNIIMAHCAEAGEHLPPKLWQGNAKTLEQMVREYENGVEQVCAIIDHLANKYNIKHTVVRLYGNSAGHAIIDFAKKNKVDLIVVGSRGIGPIRRTITGSVSDYIIHHSHVSVLICKHKDEHHKLK